MLTYNSDKANSLDTDQKERLHHGILERINTVFDLRAKTKSPISQSDTLGFRPNIKKFLDLFTSYFRQVDSECKHS